MHAYLNVMWHTNWVDLNKSIGMNAKVLETKNKNLCKQQSCLLPLANTYVILLSAKFQNDIHFSIEYDILSLTHSAHLFSRKKKHKQTNKNTFLLFIRLYNRLISFFCAIICNRWLVVSIRYRQELNIAGICKIKKKNEILNTAECVCRMIK